MARLNVHGAELLRTDITYPVTPDGDYGAVDARRVVKSYRADGSILRKDYAHFVATGPSVTQEARWHDWGWKLYRKFKAGVDLPAACERAAVKVEALASDHPDATIVVTRAFSLARAA